MKNLRLVSWLLCLAVLIIAPCLGAETITAPGPAKSGVAVTSVVDYGAVPNDFKDDTAAVTAAINACANSATKTLYFPGGTFNLAALAFPATINVVIADGALLKIQNEATVTFNSPLTAGPYQIFSDSGRVLFGNGAVSEVYPQWWYTSGGDASLAINKAINSSPLLPGVSVKLSGTFQCQTTIRVNRDRVNLIGNGIYATQLVFNPAAPLPLFEFKKTGGAVAQCAIRDMAFIGGGDKQKIGIKIVDADIIEVRNISMLYWNGNQSIGLQIQGRKMGFIENICVSADLPVSIEKNPNGATLDIDHFTFRNTYLTPMDKNGASVQIASGVTLSNVQFEGTNAWVGGKYGLLWDDTTSAEVSENLSVRNVRMEGSAAPGGDIIHINHNSALNNLVLENIYGCMVSIPGWTGAGVGGIYLRKCANATLQNIFYISQPATALDIDESSSNIVLINTYWGWNTGLVKTGTLVKTFGTNKSPANPDNRLIEVYDPPNNPQGEGLILYGAKVWCYSGELFTDTPLSLPVGSGFATKVATITVSATDGAAVSPKNESGYFMFSAGGNTITKVAGTANTAATDTPGSLCLVNTPGNPVKLKNYLAPKVDVVVTLFWR